MLTLKRTFIEILLIGGLACGLAFGTNAIRTGGKVKVGKSYFDTGSPKSINEKPSDAASTSSNAAASAAETAVQSANASLADQSGDSGEMTSDALHRSVSAPVSSYEPASEPHHDSTTGSTANIANGTDGAEHAEEDPEAHVEHEYQDIHTDEVVEVFNDPNTAYGVNLFIDARSDDAFAEGRIPRARQVHVYEVERYLTEDILALIESAEKVIVYCGGGKCEDSIFLCRDLIYEFDVPYDKVYLYGGGWNAWKARGMPVEKGR